MQLAKDTSLARFVNLNFWKNKDSYFLSFSDKSIKYFSKDYYIL